MMRAWWVDDCECYAGRTKEEALAAAMANTGNRADDYFDLEDICEAPAGQMMTVGEDPAVDPQRLVREFAAEMTEPGFICGTEL